MRSLIPISRRTFVQWLGILGVSGLGCSGDGPSQGSDGDESAIDARIAGLTLDEKATLVAGGALTLPNIANTVLAYNRLPIASGDLPARGIQGVRFTDGPRGVVVGSSTCFPVSMARAATWDPALEGRVGDAIGVEARTQGATVFAGVCVNLLRHPAWGRAQECYGEDPVLTGAMGVALLNGAQRHLMGCVKHFACNTIEDSRFHVDVSIDERALHEVFLPHFKACVEAGAAAVMSAYNKVNGEFCGQNHELLTEVIKEAWRFQGFVMSDFFLGIRDGVAAMNAGLDLEMPLAIQFGARLANAVKNGSVPESRLDDACRRLLRQTHRFETVGEPDRYRKDAVAGPEHRGLAREVAAAGMVLLQNDPLSSTGTPLLPLDPGALSRVAMVGRLINAPNLGDEGSSRVRPPYVVTPLAGLEEALSDVEIVTVEGSSLQGSEEAIETADVVIAVVGYTHEDEGENILTKGGDRKSLRLRPEDEALLLAATTLNPRTVAVVVTGSAIVSEAWRAAAPAILVVWYPGMEGGRALADLLLGRGYPGGKLPCVFPRSELDLPAFDSTADHVEYDLYHGYRLMDRRGASPAFAFGFGLGYTTFSMGGSTIENSTLRADGELVLTVTVTNTGGRAGSEVIQVYVEPPRVAVDRPVRELKAFEKVRLDRGQTQTLTLRIPVPSLSYWDESTHAFVVERGDYIAHVGTSSRAADLEPVPFTVI